MTALSGQLVTAGQIQGQGHGVSHVQDRFHLSYTWSLLNSQWENLEEQIANLFRFWFFGGGWTSPPLWMRDSIYINLFVLEISWPASQDTVLFLLILYQLQVEFNPTALFYSLRTSITHRTREEGGKGRGKTYWLNCYSVPARLLRIFKIS